MTVYVLVNVGWDDCIHTSIHRTSESAQKHAQEKDDGLHVYPHWVTAKDAETRGEHGPLQWEDDYVRPGALRARSIGCRRHWIITPEEVMD